MIKRKHIYDPPQIYRFHKLKNLSRLQIKKNPGNEIKLFLRIANLLKITDLFLMFLQARPLFLVRPTKLDLLPGFY